jgi:hypothetical protein
VTHSLRSRFLDGRWTRIATLSAYVALSLWSTWPLARQATTSLPLSTTTTPTVPLFNVWTVWWNSDRALHGFRGYWDAPIFHPVSTAFAFSEPQPTTLIVAPVIWLSGSRALAYNIYVWLSLVLNGVFAERLLRRQGLSRLPAFVGGAAMLLLPIVHWQRDVLQLIPVWGLLWTWTAFLRISPERPWRRGCELGVAFSVSCLMCVHHGLFLALLLAGTFWVLGRRLLRRRVWLALCVAGAVAGLLVSPILLPMRHALREHEFRRSPELITRLSAEPHDYAALSGEPLIDPGFGPPGVRLRLASGWIKLGLAAVACVLGLWRRRWRRWTLFLAATGLLAFVLSLGLRLYICGWQPWSTLSSIVPGLAQARNVFRFAFFVQMVAVLGAAQCLYFLFLLRRRFLTSQPWRSFAWAAILAVGCLAVIETRPAAMTLARVPDADANAAWIDFVRRQTPPGQAVASIPFAPGNRTSDFETTTEAMYFGTYHRVPLVNGYSGFFPREYFDLRDIANESFPEQFVLRRLADADVEFVILMPQAGPLKAGAVDENNRWTLQPAFEDPTGVEIHRLVRRE